MGRGTTFACTLIAWVHLPKLFSNVLTKKVSDPHTKYQMIQRTMSVWWRILQARILEWVAMPFSRRSSRPRGRTQVSHIAGRFFTVWASGEAYLLLRHSLKYWADQRSHQSGWTQGKQRPHLRAFTPQLSPPRAGWHSVSSLTCPGSQRNHQPPGHRERQIWRIVQ